MQKERNIFTKRKLLIIRKRYHCRDSISENDKHEQKNLLKISVQEISKSHNYVKKTNTLCLASLLSECS